LIVIFMYNLPRQIEYAFTLSWWEIGRCARDLFPFWIFHYRRQTHLCGGLNMFGVRNELSTKGILLYSVISVKKHQCALYICVQRLFVR